MSTLILASGSPRRRELLHAMGIGHEMRVSTIDETRILADHPRTFALRAAYAKACDVANAAEEGSWVLAADTVVSRKMILFGKPTSPADAARMLRTLAGETHTVTTGLALARAGSMKTLMRAVDTRVVFRELTNAEIDAYIQTGEPEDKAGAYGIQGEGCKLVDHIEGDYFNVVGLPCEALLELLEEAELSIQARLPETPARWKNNKGY